MGVPLIFLAPPPNYVKEQLRQGGGVPLPIRGASEALSGALCLLAAFGLVLAAPVPVSRDAFPYGTAALSPCFAFPFSAPSPSERRLSPFPVGTGGGPAWLTNTELAPGRKTKGPAYLAAGLLVDKVQSFASRRSANKTAKRL
jgi:hypothetical protein